MKGKKNIYFSAKQKAIREEQGLPSIEIKIGKDWCEYTEMSDDKSNWDDAIFLGKVDISTARKKSNPPQEG
jgi:hypothetical protein